MSMQDLNQIKNIYKIGNKLTLKRPEDENLYPSYIKDVFDDYIFIDAPSLKGTSVAVYNNDELEMSMSTPDGVWIGSAKILKVQHGQFSGLYVSFPLEVKQQQRRNAYRLEFNSKAQLFLKDNAKTTNYEMKSFNISALGLSLVSRNIIEDSPVASVKLLFKDVDIDCDVTMVHVSPEPGTKNFIHGFKFLNMDSVTENKLFKAVNAEQMILRRQGLI